VEPGDHGDAALVADLAFVVERRDAEPWIRAAVAGGPDDRGDSLAPEVERGRPWRERESRGAVRFADHALGAPAGDEGVDPIEEARETVVGVLRGSCEVVGERQ